MGYTKLRNPKSGAITVPPDGVAVTCRQLKRKVRKGGGEAPATRFAVLRIGAAIARKAGMVGDKHRANVLVGDGLERCRCGIALDEKNGEFKLKRLASGDYQLTIAERAAVGMLRLDAPRFASPAELVPIATGHPPCVMFDLSTEIREP